jgi:hypothetical protein
VPLTDGSGTPLTSGGNPIGEAVFGAGDALWVELARQAVDGLLQWATSGFLNFNGVEVDFGPLAGNYRYFRFRFQGLTVYAQTSPDNGTYTDRVRVAFGLSNLQNIYNLAQPLVEMAEGLLHTGLEQGALYSVAGGLSPTEEEAVTSIAVGNVKKLVIGMRQQSEPFQLSFHFRKTTDATGATGEADLIGDFIAQAQPALLACMSADVAITGYRVEDRISAGATNGHLRTFIGAPLVGVVGTAAAADTSNILQAAGCISWYTNFSGRGERGRSFLPGVPVVLFADNGLLTDAAITAYQAFVDALLLRYDGDTDATADWQLVLWRNHVSGAGATEANPPAGATGHVIPATHPPFNPLAAAHGITLGVPQRVVRSLRRRGVGVRIGRRGAAGPA